MSICVNMHDFYRHYLPTTEHNRIDQIEPFDEIEEWQSKCAHYILLFGLKTSSNLTEQCFERMQRDFSKVISLRKEQQIDIDEQIDCQLKFQPYSTVMTYAQRFGHQSIVINEKFVWTIGGFGTVDGRHRRLKTIEILNIENGDIQRLDNHLLEEAVFHTCHFSDNKILIFFGRKSPGILNPCVSIDINSKSVEHHLSKTNFRLTSFGNHKF